MWTSFGDIILFIVRDKGTGKNSFPTLFESEEAIGGAEILKNDFTINSGVIGRLVHCVILLQEARLARMDCYEIR